MSKPREAVLSGCGGELERHYRLRPGESCARAGFVVYYRQNQPESLLWAPVGAPLPKAAVLVYVEAGGVGLDLYVSPEEDDAAASIADLASIARAEIERANFFSEGSSSG